MTISPHRKRYLLLLFAMLLCFAIGAFFEHSRGLNQLAEWRLRMFENELHRKETHAEQHLDEMAQLVRERGVGALRKFECKECDVAYYVFHNNSLVYWSEHKYDITHLVLPSLNSDELLRLQTASFVTKLRREQDFTYLALIKIKSHFESENDYIRNSYAANFHLDSSVDLVKGKDSDANAIRSQSGKYLFSLSSIDENANVLSQYLSLMFWCVGILLLFAAYLNIGWWWGRRVYMLRNALLTSLCFVAFVFLFLSLRIPEQLFKLELFSPIYFSTGGYMSSMGHLIVITLLFLSLVYTFCFRVYLKPTFANNVQKAVWLIGIQLFSGAFFMLVLWMVSDLLQHATFNVTIFRLQDISYFSLIAILLIGVWFSAYVLFRNKGISILFKFCSLRQLLLADMVIALILGAIIVLVSNVSRVWISLSFFCLSAMLDWVRYKNMRYFSYPTLTLVVVMFSIFIVWYTFEQERFNRFRDERAIATAVYNNSLQSSDLFATHALASLDSIIDSDANIKRYMAMGTPSSATLTRYMSKYYFDTWKDMCNIKTVVYPKHMERRTAYYDELVARSQPIAPHFYSTYNVSQSCDYVGRFVFPQLHGDTMLMYLEVSVSNKNNYSYPNRLFQLSEEQLPIYMSVAKYESGRLYSSYGTLKYPLLQDKLIGEHKGERTFYNAGYMHTLFSFDSNSLVVVSENQLPDVLLFCIYAIYLLSIYLVMAILIYIVWRRVNHIRPLSTMFNRLLRSLMIFFVVGITLMFAVIGYLYVNQSKRMLNEERRLRLEYVKNSLTSAFANERELTENNVNVALVLSELSNTLETDIHLYNLSGELIATSRPIVFLNGYVSRLMNSDVFFHHSLEDDVRVSETISLLRYNTSYARLCNKSGEAIAYVSVPTFDSLLNFREEMFRVLAVIVFIYLVLLMLSVFVCYLLARGISSPMKSLEARLKSIRFGKQNVKIEYESDTLEEIGQLIEQYNNMVDELAYSAEMLAKTEREQAWKQMARQIAHEIKNPLTPMKLTVQQLQRMKANGSDKFDAYFDKTANVLIEQIDNLSRISTEFSDFARMPETELMTIDIVARLVSIVDLFKNNYNSVKLHLHTSVEKAYILSDKTQITQIFNNLLLNAMQSIPIEREGVIVVEVGIADGDYVVVSVADNGCGVADEVKERIFLPNFTTKNSGMGLGLAIVKNLIIMLNGEIYFTTKENEGTTFFVKFPLQKGVNGNTDN